MTAETARASLADWLAGRGVSLSADQWSALERFVAELRAAAARTNLTADLDEDSWWLRHIADGFAALPLLRAALPAAPSIADLGAGAGFVGIALKIAWPESRVTLIESSYRKFQFLNAAAATLGTPGLRVVWQRAGGPAASGAFDAVLERAVAPLPEAVALALPLARPGGRFLAWQSAPPAAGDRALEKALKKYGAALEQTVPYRLPGEDRDRALLLFARPDKTP